MISYFLSSSLFLLLLSIICLFSRRKSSPRTQWEPHSTLAQEKAKGGAARHQQPVPGDSPAYYLGDASHDVLQIRALDLVPNSLKATNSLLVNLLGEIKEDIGLDPQLHMTAYLNGHRLGPSSGEVKLCVSPRLEITQGGVPLTRGETPTNGAVTMCYKNLMLYTLLQKGWYTIRVEMYASEEVGKARMTGFEGAIWIEGGGPIISRHGRGGGWN